MMNRKMADWQRVTFDEAFTDITAKANKVDQSEFLHSGKYPIVDQGQKFIAGYTDNDELVWGDDLPVVIFGDHTRILKYVDFPFVLGADGTKVLKPNKDILPLFAYYQLLSFDIPSAGYSRHFKFLKDFSFQYPPLTEQKRIASLLARADRLRHLRRTAHELGESLLQSVFLEMFGDVTRNEKGWDIYPIEEYVNVQGGYSFKSEDFIKSGVKVVKITNVHYGHLTWQDDTEFLPLEYLDKYSAFSLHAGDIVMSLTRPIIKSLNTVKVCQVQESDTPCLLNQRVGRLLIKNPDKIIPEYLLHFCYSQHFKKKVDDYLSESLQPNISINQVGEIEIPVPPLSLQEEFASVVARVESLRERMGESTRQVEGLFESLLAESFS